MDIKSTFCYMKDMHTGKERLTALVSQTKSLLLYYGCYEIHVFVDRVTVNDTNNIHAPTIMWSKTFELADPDLFEKIGDLVRPTLLKRIQNGFKKAKTYFRLG